MFSERGWVQAWRCEASPAGYGDMHGHANSKDVDHTKFWYRTCRCLQAGDWAMFISKRQLSMTTPRGRLCRLRYTGDRVTGGPVYDSLLCQGWTFPLSGWYNLAEDGPGSLPSLQDYDRHDPAMMWGSGRLYFSSTNMTVIINDYQWYISDYQWLSGSRCSLGTVGGMQNMVNLLRTGMIAVDREFRWQGAYRR